ncbi:MAG: hypothetical protein SFZ02_18850 [bacterium]|nr:hypothetical protein [bacterium]
MTNRAWEAIFEHHHISQHDFDIAPYLLSADDIKEATQQFKATGEREAQILCKQDTRESRPELFKSLGLFVLPIKNGLYALIRGEGYVDLPEIESPPILHRSILTFPLETAWQGNSEMQHLDYAYAVSLVRTFMDDPTLVLTIRGRKYTPSLSFRANGHELTVEKVHTKVNGGYEGKNQVVLVRTRDTRAKNIVIRQIFYPYRQWSQVTNKPVHPIFFVRQGREYHFWRFAFTDADDYTSIKLIEANRLVVDEN